MADYNENELNRMRRDALRRMQEMQRRAMPRPNEAPSPKPGDGGAFPLAGALFGGGKAGKPLNIAGIAVDEEKAMIAMLIYILYKQGGDIKLLLALAYLLL